MPRRPSTTESIHPVVQRFITEAGAASQAFGFGRVIGQIYACLYFSESPLTLDDLQNSLGISKGSASMGTRKLEQWDAIRKVWVRGDRKDYFTASDAFGRILRKVIAETVAKGITNADEVIAESLAEADAELDSDFIRDRLARLATFRDRVTKVWDSTLVKSLVR